MKCSIIIPTRLRAELLRETLDSLASQTATDYEVIVVCDGADIATSDMAAKHRAPYPLRWIFHSANRGPAIARNSGAAAAAGELLLFLDDDVSASTDCIRHHCTRHANAYRKKLVVIGEIIQTYRCVPDSFCERAVRQEWNKWWQELHNQRLHAEKTGASTIERLACLGVNCSVPRSLFLQSGGYDAVMCPIDEDMELGYRLHRSGVQFAYEPLAVVTHNDTKILSKYFTDCWRNSGPLDAYRVTQKGQRCAQTQTLIGIHRGNALRRCKARLAWEHPKSFRRLAQLSRSLAETTKSRPLVSLWTRLLMAAEYWDGVRRAGLTKDHLRQLAGQPLPILLFHSIARPQRPNERTYYTAPRRFRRFLKWIKLAGYSPATAEEWARGEAPPQSVALHFDDAYDDFYTEVFPLLAHTAFKPTLFVVVDHIGKTNSWDARWGLRSRKLLSREQIRELHRHGVRIGSHSLTHASLPNCSDAELARELGESKLRLEDLLGAPVTSFAYPWGKVDGRVRVAVAEAGYELGMSCEPGLNCWQDPLCMRRIDVSDTDTLLDFHVKLATGYDWKQEGRNWLRRLLPSRQSIPRSASAPAAQDASTKG